jgi:hypothetical protein
MADLDTSTWPPRYKGAFFKGPRGKATLDKEKAAREETAAELLVKADVKARDRTCRCPLRHKCRGGMEVIHWKDRSLGGEFSTRNLWLGCAFVHRTGPVSIHGKDIEIEPLTKKGLDGPCAWWLLKYPEGWGKPKRTLIARESAVGVVER